MHFTTRTALIATALLACAGATLAANSKTVTVMTRNMDAGTDLGLALAYLNSSTPTVGIDLTYQEIIKSNFEGRAGVLAHEIHTIKPQLVSLQEVTLWMTGPDPASLAPLFDQLELLAKALTAMGEDYSVVAVNQLTTTALPMSSGAWLGFMDRDAVLVRNDAGLTITGARKALFSTKLSFPTPLGNIDIMQGWIAVDVVAGGKTFTFVDTHLESPVPGVPEASLVQEAQATELVAILTGTSPAIIAGDFNSNATHTPNERTQSLAIILQAGFTDAWPVANHGNPGFTWPLYQEDPSAAHKQGPFERIDFILERGFTVRSVDRIGWKPPYASDHAGVVAELSL